MGTAFNLEAISGALASAALDSGRWNAALETVTRGTNAFGAILLPLDRQPQLAPITDSLAPATDYYFREGWSERDERFRGRELLVANGVVTDFDFISRDQVNRHPYYQDFLARFRLKGWAAVRIGRGKNAWSLAIQRTVEQDNFEPHELASLRELSRQSENTALVAEALAFARADGALAAFDMAKKGAILLDARGRILRQNAAAEGFYGRDIMVRDQRLTSPHAGVNARLNLAIRNAVWGSQFGALNAVAFPRTDRGAAVAYIMRTPTLTETPLSQGAAIVILADTDERTEPEASTLHAAFGLTRAEARLALALGSGDDLTVLSKQLGISRETARSQLRAIFGKTSTNRQAELVAKISQLLPGK